MTIFLTINSNNLDLIDYFLNSISYPYSNNGTITTKTLTMKKINDVENCLGSVNINQTIYTKQQNQCYSCAQVTDTDLISCLNYFINSSIQIPSINIIIDETSYVCDSYITISGKPYYILN